MEGQLFLRIIPIISVHNPSNRFWEVVQSKTSRRIKAGLSASLWALLLRWASKSSPPTNYPEPQSNANEKACCLKPQFDYRDKESFLYLGSDAELWFNINDPYSRASPTTPTITGNTKAKAAATWRAPNEEDNHQVYRTNTVTKFAWELTGNQM